MASQLSSDHPHPFTVGVLGLGAIGAIVAQRLAAIGWRLRAWSRSPKQLAGVDCFYGQDGLDNCLGQCDAVVNLLPLTPATAGILSQQTFARCPRGAYLINVGRGQHLVEADLLDALDSGQLSGACLDVFEQEPLPQTHPFWRHPQITVTPHVAAVGHIDFVVDYILDAVTRVETGQPLQYVVDRQRGY